MIVEVGMKYIFPCAFMYAGWQGHIKIMQERIAEPSDGKRAFLHRSINFIFLLL